MANKDGKPHFHIENAGTSHEFRKAASPVSKAHPTLDPTAHGAQLLGHLEGLIQAQEYTAQLQTPVDIDRVGLQVTFKSFEGFELAFESLSSERDGIELLNIQIKNNTYFATVFIPEGKLVVFQRKLEKYVETSSNEKIANKKLIESIANFHQATLGSLWTDAPDLLPSDKQQVTSWEVWLPRGDGQAEVDFKRLAHSLEIPVASRKIEFRERVVRYIEASIAQLTSSVHLLNTIAELRKPKETAEFFDNLTIEEQRDWSSELLERLSYEPEDHNPTVTIIDTGVNIAHPLLAPFSSQDKMFTTNDAFGWADVEGHGTNMAGIALWGDLKDSLELQGSVTISHNLESVKIINQNGDNEDQAYGAIITEATILPEMFSAATNRIYTIAICATDTRDMGRPSAWSAAIDELCFNRLGEQDPKRLFIVAAGNSKIQPVNYNDYPAYLDSHQIHDPGQSWNALTVGAYTEKVTIAETGYTAPVADVGEISPYSSTSTEWDARKPIKPDVVFEGGNIALEPTGGFSVPSLSLLTTDHSIQERLFTTFWATSAATALAANFSAKVFARYPNLRPETVRALVIHSASWTDAMYAQFASTGTEKQKSAQLIQRVGHGVPDLEKALDSASQRASVIIEDSIKPFKKDNSVKFNELRLHDLPWPTELLQELGNTDVKLTITLSYFIEPNPSNRAFSNKYSYQSHNLGFELKRSLESNDQLLQRISTGNQPDDFKAQGDSGQWLIGPRARAHGSVSKDVWEGTAVDLASMDKIVVVPGNGWWKTRTSFKLHDEEVRYSLVLTIETPASDVDLYTAIENVIQSTIATQVDINT